MEEIEMAEEGDAVINIGDCSEKMTQKESVQSEKKGKRKREEAPAGRDCLQNLIQSMEDLNDTRSFTIFRVPPRIREKSKTMYEPNVVSIGPYYHGTKDLQTMEEHKRRCLRDFLKRNTERSLEDYYQEMKRLERWARQCYSESIKMDSDEFVLMLLLDGCFILEYFLKWRDNILDAFCDARWDTTNKDIFLLENQVPFFVIHRLAFLLSDPICNHKCSLLSLIFEFLPCTEMITNPELPCDAVDHLLHFYYKCMVPEIDSIEPINFERPVTQSIKQRWISWIWSWLPSPSREGSSLDIFPCASILHESGVTFRRKKNPRHIFDITFGDGVIEMPFLRMGTLQKIIFTNIKSLEQSKYSTTKFTSFTQLMDNLVDTGKDIALLKQYGIMESLLENDERAAAFFNQLAQDGSMNYQDHYFARFFKQVKEYSNSTWPKYRARLMHDYLSNPWTFISVSAGVILLGLTVTQTYYTIYSAYHH